MEAPLVHLTIVGWMVATLATFVAECLFLAGILFDLSWSSEAGDTRFHLAGIAAFVATSSGLISLMLAAAAYKFSLERLPWQVGLVAGAIAVLGITTSLAYLF